MPLTTKTLTAAFKIRTALGDYVAVAKIGPSGYLATPVASLFSVADEAPSYAEPAPTFFSEIPHIVILTDEPVLVRQRKAAEPAPVPGDYPLTP